MQKECQIQSCKNNDVLYVLKEQVTIGLWNIEVSGAKLVQRAWGHRLKLSGYNPLEFQRDT